MSDSLENVGKRYGSGTEILQDVTVTLDPGGFYFLTGVSGAGKTTLLKIIYFAERASRGLVSIFDTDIATVDRIATASASGSLPTTTLAPPPGQQPGTATGPYELYCPGSPVGNIVLNDTTTTATITPSTLTQGQQFSAVGLADAVLDPPSRGGTGRRPRAHPDHRRRHHVPGHHRGVRLRRHRLR